MNEQEVVVNQEPVVETPAAQEIPEAKSQRIFGDADKEKNMRELRERARRAEERATELEKQFKQQQTPPDDFGFEDDALIEGKHLKKYVNNVTKKLKETEDRLAAFTTQSAEVRLKTRFNDFESVVTSDNLEKLASQEPELYRSMISNPDLYDKGATAYRTIKSFVAAEKYDQVDRKLEENKSKPRSAGSSPAQASESPLSHVGEYGRIIIDEEKRKQVLRRLEDAKKYR